MRGIAPTLATVMLLGLAFAPPALSQNLPSAVEQRLGIRPNSLNNRGMVYRRVPPQRYGYDYRRPAVHCWTRGYRTRFDRYRGIYVRYPVRVCRPAGRSRYGYGF